MKTVFCTYQQIQYDTLSKPMQTTYYLQDDWVMEISKFLLANLNLKQIQNKENIFLGHSYSSDYIISEVWSRHKQEK